MIQRTITLRVFNINTGDKFVNKGFNSKKPRNLEEIENEHDSQMKNIETLTKIKRKCGEFLESQEKIMSSPLVSYLMKGIKILAKYPFFFKALICFL